MEDHGTQHFNPSSCCLFCCCKTCGVPRCFCRLLPGGWRLFTGSWSPHFDLRTLRGLGQRRGWIKEGNLGLTIREAPGLAPGLLDHSRLDWVPVPISVFRLCFNEVPLSLKILVFMRDWWINEKTFVIRQNNKVIYLWFILY